ncbi:MAG: glutathione S-transferase family protein [Gammaproteobacteria bacterium]|nr:glutathione S-transferase family protein [Gammaproteobacteria bacterium]
MFRLHGFFTQNSRKPLYVLSELGVDFEFVYVDLMAGEQRTEDFLQMNPLGKVPVLEHDGRFLAESGAICRYVANVIDSGLYPADKLQRAKVDQWLDYFSCHLGRWLTTLYFETIIRPRANLGDPNRRSIEEATKFIGQQLPLLDTHLTGTQWLANDALSIADICALAYVEQSRDVDVSLQSCPQVSDWFSRLDQRDGIVKARALLQS